MALLHLQAHHGLGVAVEHCQRPRRAAHAHERQQRAHAQHRGEPVAHRAGRQLTGEMACRGSQLRLARRSPRLTQRQGARGGAPGGPLGREAGRAQATVERVEQHPVEGPGPPDLHLEPIGDERGTIRRCRQDKLELRGPHGRGVCHGGARTGLFVRCRVSGSWDR
jgi:hypothetical protein